MSRIGFIKLRDKLIILKESYINEAKNIASIHTAKFVESVEKLIYLVEERLTHNEDIN